jgi:hypothetical protein
LPMLGAPPKWLNLGPAEDDDELQFELYKFQTSP